MPSKSKPAEGLLRYVVKPYLCVIIVRESQPPTIRGKTRFSIPVWRQGQGVSRPFPIHPNQGATSTSSCPRDIDEGPQARYVEARHKLFYNVLDNWHRDAC